MKYGSNFTGVIIEGATLYNPTEQGIAVVRFAMSHGFKCVLPDSNTDNWSDIDYDMFDYLVEDAIEYLNTKCVEDGFVFTFEDTDFVLIGYDGLDSTSKAW